MKRKFKQFHLYQWNEVKLFNGILTPTPKWLDIQRQSIQKQTMNKGNAKRGVSLRLKIWPGDLDFWPMTLKINRVPDSLKD
jgi:hypothetical protein